MHRYFPLYIFFFFLFSNFTSCVIETKPVLIYSHNQGKNSERKNTFVLLGCSVTDGILLHCSCTYMCIPYIVEMQEIKFPGYLFIYLTCYKALLFFTEISGSIANDYNGHRSRSYMNFAPNPRERLLKDR